MPCRQLPKLFVFARQLASLNCRSKNVGILAIVISELEFGNIQRQVFPADFVEASHDPALQDRPEAFNSLRVDRADNVLMRAMVNDAMRVALFGQTAITGPAIGAEQADLVRDRFIDERGQCRSFNVLNDPSHDVTFARRALIPFLLTSIRCATQNQSLSGLFVFSKMVPVKREKRWPVDPPGARPRPEARAELAHVGSGAAAARGSSGAVGFCASGAGGDRISRQGTYRRSMLWPRAGERGRMNSVTPIRQVERSYRPIGDPAKCAWCGGRPRSAFEIYDPAAWVFRLGRPGLIGSTHVGEAARTSSTSLLRGARAGWSISLSTFAIVAVRTASLSAERCMRR
jgi:hypothetical protein